MVTQYRLTDENIARLEKRKQRLLAKQHEAVVRGQSRIVRQIDTSVSYIEMVLEGVYEYD